MARDPNFFLRKFVQFKPVLAEELKNRGVYVQNTWPLLRHVDVNRLVWT